MTLTVGGAALSSAQSVSIKAALALDNIRNTAYRAGASGTPIDVSVTNSSYYSVATNLALAFTSSGQIEGDAIRLGIFNSGSGAITVTLPSGNVAIPSSSALTTSVSVAAGTETYLGLVWSVRLSKYRLVSVIDGF